MTRRKRVISLDITIIGNSLCLALTPFLFLSDIQTKALKSGSSYSTMFTFLIHCNQVLFTIKELQLLTLAS